MTGPIKPANIAVDIVESQRAASGGPFLKEEGILKSLAFEAMIFAREVHKDQRRKYTGNLYIEHLAEVVATSMSVGWHYPSIHPDTFMAVGWLHDCVEDQFVTEQTLQTKFGYTVAMGVLFLTEASGDDRKEIHSKTLHKLSSAPGWVQDIKVADIISNCKDIRTYDSAFAVKYLQKKWEVLLSLGNANERLLEVAKEIVLKPYS